MKTFLKWLALAPILAIVLIFAVANRQIVHIVFNPFGGSNSDLSISAPLFLALFAAVILGVLLGGGVVWLGQSKHRKAARMARTEADRLRGDNERLRASSSLTSERTIV